MLLLSLSCPDKMEIRCSLLAHKLTNEWEQTVILEPSVSFRLDVLLMNGDEQTVMLEPSLSFSLDVPFINEDERTITLDPSLSFRQDIQFLMKTLVSLSLLPDGSHRAGGEGVLAAGEQHRGGRDRGVRSGHQL